MNRPDSDRNPYFKPSRRPPHAGWSMFWINIVTVTLFLSSLLAAARCAGSCGMPNIWT